MTSLVNTDISENNTPKNDNFLTTVTTAYSKSSSTASSTKDLSEIKSNTNDTSKSEETFLKIVDYATFIDDSYNKKPVTSGNKIECKFTEEYTHNCKGWELLLHEGYTETPDSTGLISPSISK